MIALFGRYASRVVQKAHARVTAENARYVREAIERDAEIERLTQERDQARKQAADCQAQGVSLARSTRGLIASNTDKYLGRIGALEADLDRANSYVSELEEALREADLHSETVIAAKDELIARMDAELTEVSGRLADALERLALVDREEDMRDEARAKRSSDL